ncbi:MAG: hypothetical protein NTW07_07430 [candidate division Zixibacteria bacterium]|nr:hypothetical protein [candidate division Zixibacteria bacterium]
MNKKTMIVYTFLFLFAFTFALSFTLALAEPPEHQGCCIMSYCPGTQVVQQWGHMVDTTLLSSELDARGPDDWVCMQEGGNPCDWTYQCGPSVPPGGDNVGPRETGEALPRVDSKEATQ